VRSGAVGGRRAEVIESTLFGTSLQVVGDPLLTVRVEAGEDDWGSRKGGVLWHTLN
jgi:hypothetical protein